jgi:hypothetical protein
MPSEAFVYCWTDHATDKLYIGWHKGSVDDGYICSSKYMKEQYLNRPNDFTRQIVASGTIGDMTNLETVLLRSADAKNNEQFYNLHNGDGFYRFGPHSSESILKMKKPKSEDHKMSMRLNHADVSGKNNPMYGRSIISERNLKWYTNGHEEVYVPEGEQPKNWYKGRKIKGRKYPERTKEHCERISKSKKGKPSGIKGYKYEKVTCPHCGAVGGGGNMTRLHFDNCKVKS